MMLKPSHNLDRTPVQRAFSQPTIQNYQDDRQCSRRNRRRNYRRNVIRRKRSAYT
jgi:hypothetical protein